MKKRILNIQSEVYLEEADEFLVMNNPEFHYAYVYNRIGTKVRLLGQPSEKIEILDDFRNK